jgi:protein-S-isoprenylcysteine O-methyltransferase Ste14
VAANLLASIAPLRFGLGDIGQIAGWCLATLAILLVAWSFLTFRMARSNILPHKAADSLITGGPFTFSRNPIYLSEAILLVALGLINGSLWYWLLTPAFMVAVARLGIRREEAHMAAKFGAAWTAYASTVRRWL